MKVRVVSKGWETFTGSMGHKAIFKDGVSVDELDARQIARIGSTVRLVDVETGNQVGPAEVARMLQARAMTFVPTHDPEKAVEARKASADDERQRLAAEEKARKEADAAALAEAQKKAEESADEEVVVYSRQELEAIGANDGIAGLREIAAPLGVKGRAIDELVGEILKAQIERVKA